MDSLALVNGLADQGLEEERLSDWRPEGLGMTDNLSMSWKDRGVA